MIKRLDKKCANQDFCRLYHPFDESIDEKNIDRLSDKEIIDAFLNGCNPYTGEIIDILNDKRIHEFFVSINNRFGGKWNVSKRNKDELDSEELILFNQLKKWRMDVTIASEYNHAYMVFTDQELINIVVPYLKGEIKRKEDLIRVKGIGDKKYIKYSDDIWEILTTGVYSGRPIIF